jgi:hypothetical protein
MSDVFKVHIDDPNPAEIEELTLIISEGPQVIAVDGMIIGRNGTRYRVTKIEIRAQNARQSS